MQKKILIIIGATVIVLMLGGWLYLFLFGTPDNISQSLNNLRSPSTPYEQPIVGTPETTINVDSKNLAQLSTKSVAGFVLPSTNQNSVRYAEKGTGHIYEINLLNGTEERLSGTTVVNTTEAYFSLDGEEVILVSDDGTNRKVTWKAVANSTDSASLPVNSYDFSWNADKILRYTVKNTGSTIAYEDDGSTSEELWQVPLSDIRVFFTNDGDYISNNPSSGLSGGLFKVENSKLVSIVPMGYTFTAVVDPVGQYFLYRYYDNDLRSVTAKVKNTSTNENISTALSSIPEKCAFDPNRPFIWCASSFSLLSPDRTFLNRWYRGEVSSPDSLWVASYSDLGISTFVIDLSEEAGFDVDVVDMTISEDGNTILFRNKINDALWMYKLEEQPESVDAAQEEEGESDSETATTTN